MIPEFEKRVALRLSKKQRKQIDKLVRAGEFKSLSHVIRVALTDFFESKFNDWSK
jgi:Arc/MetJ-type ribon-helix-helix transcriptional regulator